MRSSSHFLKIFLLCFLILSGGSLSGCAGLGAPGDAGISSLSQGSNPKNTGANNDNAGDPTSETADNGSPGQPSQPGVGLDKPRPDPVPGGTVTTSITPTGETAIDKCEVWDFVIRGIVRPPALADADCVEFSSPPVVTVWVQYSEEEPWIRIQDLPPISVDDCGSFYTTLSFDCVKPVSIKIDAVYGYLGTFYEAWSDEMPLPSDSAPPQMEPPLEDPGEGGEDPVKGDSPGEQSPDSFDEGASQSPSPPL